MPVRRGLGGSSLGFLSVIISLCLALGVTYGLLYWSMRGQTDRSAYVGLYLVYGLPGILLIVAGSEIKVHGGDLGPAMLAIGLGLSLPLVKSFRIAVAHYIPIDPNSSIDLSGLCVFLAVLGFLLVTSVEAPLRIRSILL